MEEFLVFFQKEFLENEQIKAFSLYKIQWGIFSLFQYC